MSVQKLPQNDTVKMVDMFTITNNGRRCGCDFGGMFFSLLFFFGGGSGPFVILDCNVDVSVDFYQKQ